MASQHVSYQPQSRERHLAVPIGKKLYVWGGFLGFEGSSDESSPEVLEIFDNSTELWEQKRTHGAPPIGLCNSAYTVVGSTIYSIGGYSSGVSQNPGITQLETSTLDWVEIVPGNPTAGPKRSALANCGVVPYQDDKLAVVATASLREEGTTIDDLHLFLHQEGTWMTVPTTGTKPPSCARFSFTQISDTLAVFFGGSTASGYLNDAYILDLDKKHWTKLEIPEGQPIPPPRAYHATCCIAGPLSGQECPFLLVIGGRSARRKVLGDIWLLDIHGKKWTEIALPKPVTPRHGHTATVFGSSPDFREVVVWGGRSTMSGEPIGETTLLDLELQKGNWMVTAVITQEELGQPAARLRNKTKKLWNMSDFTQKQRQEEKPNRTEKRAKAAAQDGSQKKGSPARGGSDSSVRDIQSKLSQAEQTITLAWQEVELLNQQLVRANSRVRDAEERAKQLEARTHVLEERARRSEQEKAEAERRAESAETRAAEADRRARDAEQSARFAEDQLRRVLRESRQLAVQSDDRFWVVHRDEIELTTEQLGKGGWGMVYVAKFRGLKVAAKHLHGVIISEYNCQMFIREMTIAARLRHPNLIQFLGATVEGVPIILTELMETSLRAILEQRALTSQEKASLSLDIARALNYLHLTRPDPIVHRDVSSANVLLEMGPKNLWKAKVADLGSANFVKHISTAGPGNPSYAAPEATNPSQQSPKMDVYSYGMLLLEMHTRRFPQTLSIISHLDSISQPTLVTMIKECLEYNPKNRPSMSVVVEKLQ